MTDREYARWIQDAVVAPIRRQWGPAWPVLVPALRDAVVHSHLFAVVHSWTDDERGRTVSEAEIDRLVRATLDAFGDEIT